MGVKSGDVVKVGVRLDFSDLNDQIKEANSKLENMGNNASIGDGIKRDILDAQRELKELQNTLTNISKSKVSVGAFSTFQNKITEQVKTLEQRTSLLESSMSALISTMSSADASGFKKWIADVKNGMQGIADTTKETTQAIANVVNATGGNVDIIDTDGLDARLKKMQELKKRVRNLMNGKTDEPFEVDNYQEAVDELNSAVSAYQNALEKLNKISPGQKGYTEARENLLDQIDYIVSITKAAEKLGDNDFGKIYDTLFSYRGKPVNFANIEADIKSELSAIETYAASKIANIESQIGKSAQKISIPQSQIKDNKYVIPLDFDLSSSGITEKVMSVIRSLQERGRNNPIELEIDLTSRGEKFTKKAQEALSKFQAEVNGIQDETERNRMQGLLNSISSGFGKQITFELANSVYESKKAIRALIAELKLDLQKNPISLNPKIEFKEEDINEAEKQIKALAEQLTNMLSEVAIDSSTGTKNADFIEDLLKKVKTILNQIQSMPEKAKASLSKIPESMEGLFTKINDLRNEFLKLDTLDMGQERAAALANQLERALSALNKIIGLQGPKSNIGSMFKGWRGSDSDTRNRYGHAHLLERSALVDDEGIVHGDYSYGESNSTGNFAETHKRISKTKKIIADIHSHASDMFVKPSVADFKHFYQQTQSDEWKDLQYGIIAAYEDLAVFNAKQFFKDYSKKINFKSDKTWEDLKNANNKAKDIFGDTRPDQFLVKLMNEHGGGFDKVFTSMINDSFSQFIDKDMPLDEITKNFKSSLKKTGKYSQALSDSFGAYLLNREKNSMTKEEVGNLLSHSSVKDLFKHSSLPNGFNENNRDYFMYNLQQAMPRIIKNAWGIDEADFAKYFKIYDYGAFEKENPLNLPKGGLDGLFENTGIEKFSDNINNAIKVLQDLSGVLENIVALSQSGAFNFGIDDASVVAQNIQTISSSLSELLDIYKQLNGYGENDLGIQGIEKTIVDIQAVAEAIKRIDVSDKESVTDIKNLFGGMSLNKALMLYKDARPDDIDKSNSSFYEQWANNLVSILKEAGIELDAFKVKQEEVLKPETLIDSSQYEAIAQAIAKASTGLEHAGLTDSLNELKTTLLELSGVIQQYTGIFSASTLDAEFEKIKRAAEELNKIKLTTKEGKEGKANLLSQYQKYLSMGGTKPVDELGVKKSLKNYIEKNLQASSVTASEEAGAMDEVSPAANKAAEAKENFAMANAELLNSIIESVAGLDAEGKAFENLNRLINNIGSEKGAKNLEATKRGLQELYNLLSQPVSADSIIKSLENLANTGDALKDLSTVLNAPKKQLQKAQEALNQGGGIAYDYTQEKLNNNLEDITANGKAFLSQYGLVLNSIVKENSNGLIEMIGLVKTADNTLKEITITSANGMKGTFNVTKQEENSARLLKQAQNYEKVRRAWERMNAPTPNETSEIFFDKDSTNAMAWQNMVELFKGYEDQIGQIQKISRQVRQGKNGELLESFSAFGDKGHITVGREGESVASHQDLVNIEAIIQAYDELYKNRKRYYELSMKAAAGKEMSDYEVRELQELNSQYAELQDQINRVNKELGDNSLAQKAYKEHAEKSGSYFDKFLAEYQGDINKKLQNVERNRANQRNDFTPEYTAQLDGVKERLTEINELRAKYQDGQLWDPDDLAKVQKNMDYIADTMSQINSQGNILAKTEDVDKWISKLNDSLSQNSAMPSSLKKRYQDLISTLYSVRSAGDDTAEGLASISKTDLGKLIAQARELDAVLSSGPQGKSFLESFSGAINSQTAQFLAQFFSLRDFIRYGREIAQTVTAVDSALIELQKVSDASNERIQQSFTQSAETAKELGATITDVIGHTADWARLGYSVDQAEDLARVTQLYQNVGDNMTADLASQSLISTLKGFQMDASEAEGIVDRFNEVANNYAIDTAGIGEALQRSASAFNASHTSLDKSIALITATNTVMQSPEKVGTLWNTVSARIRGASSELEDLGEETDDYVTSTSKLRDTIKGYTGFDIMEADGKTYKDLYDIMIGIGEQWYKLQDVERAALGEALGGKRNVRGLYAIFDNMDTLVNAYNTSMTSAGSAAKEQEHYAQSVEFSINRAKASLQELATDFMSSDLLKGAIDTAQKLLEIVDNIVDKIGSIPSILGVIGGLDLFKAMLPNGQSLIGGIVSAVTESKAGRVSNTLAGNVSILKGLKQAKGSSSKPIETVKSIASEIEEEYDTMSGMGSVAADAVNTVGDATKKAGADAAVGASGLAKFITALKGLSTAAKVGIGVGVVAGVAAVGYGIYKQHKENLHQQATAATESWNQQKKAIQDYADQYETLKNKLDSGNLSESETVAVKQQILELQKQIVTQYGDQVGRIDLVNGRLQTQLGIIKSISKEQAQQNINDNRKAYEDAEKEMTKSFDRDLYTGALGDYGGQIKKLAEDAELSIRELEDGTYTISVDANPEEAQKRIGQFLSGLDNLNKQHPDDYFINDIIGFTDDRYKEVKKKTDKHLDNYKAYLENQLFKSGDASQLFDYSEAIDNYNNALATGSTEEIEKAKAAFEEAEVKKQKFLDASNIDYSPLFDEIHNGLNQSIIDINEAKKELAKNPLTDLVKNKGFSRTDFEAALMSNGEGSGAMRMLGYQFGLTKDDMDQMTPAAKQFVDILVDLGIVSADASEVINELDASFNQFSSSAITALEAVDTLNAAFANSFGATGLSIAWDSETGAITGDIATLVAAYQDLEDFDPGRLFENTATGIHVNRDELRKLQAQEEALQKQKFAEKEADLQKELREAIQRKNEALRDGSYDGSEDGRISTLTSQLETVNQLSAAYNGATSAYQKWLQAQSGGEEGDRYDQIQSTAIERAKELREAGLVGTNEFRALANLFSYEDLSTASIDELVSAFDLAYPKMESFFKEGYDGASNFIDELVRLKYATKDGDVVNIEANSLDEFASKLGISAEAVEIIFAKLRDFGFDVHFFDIDQLGLINDANSKILEIQNNLRQLGDTNIPVFDPTTLDTADEINDKIKELESLKSQPEISGTLAEQQIDELISILKEKWDLLNGYKASPTVTYQGVVEAESAYETLMKAVQTLGGEKYGFTVDAMMEMPDIARMASELEKLPDEIKIGIGIDGLSAQEIVQQMALTIPPVPVEVEPVVPEGAVQEQIPETVETKVNVKSNAQELVNMLKKPHTANFKAVIINGEEFFNPKGTLTLTPKLSTVLPSMNKAAFPWMANGTAHSSGTDLWNSYNAHAHGKWGLNQDEEALINEVGPEIVVRGDKWMTFNNGYPTFASLKKGDIVFNARQSEDLLKRGKTNSHARAEGTAHAIGAEKLLAGINKGLSGTGTSAKGSVYASASTNKVYAKAAKSSASAAKSSASAAKSSKDAAEESKNILDEIQILLDRTQRLIDAADKIVQNTAELYKTRHSQITEELSHLDDLIKYNQQGYDRYIQEANSVGLDEEWASKVREGRIDIEKIDDDDLWQKIQDYQQWYHYYATLYSDIHVKIA